MRSLAIGFAVLVLSLAPGTLLGQSKSANPWDPAVEAAAERAVTRLGSKTSLEIRATVVTIPQLVAR